MNHGGFADAIGANPPAGGLRAIEQDFGGMTFEHAQGSISKRHVLRGRRTDTIFESGSFVEFMSPGGMDEKASRRIPVDCFRSRVLFGIGGQRSGGGEGGADGWRAVYFDAPWIG